MYVVIWQHITLIKQECFRNQYIDIAPVMKNQGSFYEGGYNELHTVS